MIIDGKHLIADEGKILKRTVGSAFMAQEVFLGLVKIDGVLVEDVPENYIEIDIPEPKENKHGGEENK